MSIEIGYEVSEPEEKCSDPNCPFHGNLSVRGNTLEGKVASNDMEKTVVIERQHEIEIPKYERKERRRSRISAHLPPCLDVEEGDIVKIVECRPLSKTKKFTVIETK